MKKTLKWIGRILLLAIGVIAVWLIYFVNTNPDVGPPSDIKIEPTKERLKRGEYLANHVAVCIDCHSTRNWSLYSGPITPNTLGKGGEFFGENFGFPGNFYSKNISPAGIKDWTDGEVLRAITCGVNKQGTALFPLMPYQNYGKSSQEDMYSILTYIRSLQPIENAIPERSINFPMNLIVRTIPKPAQFSPMPDPSDSVAYGQYLVRFASCADCHTQAEKGEKLPGMDFAGGFVFTLPWGTVRSANITPDKETGIGSWTKAQFIGKFKTFNNEAAKQIAMKPPYSEAYFNTIMPWTMFAGMTEEDLGAIYNYLRTVKPVVNKVQKYSQEGATY